MTTTNLHRPEPLGVFLDRGGDLRAALGEGFEGFVEDDVRSVAVWGHTIGFTPDRSRAMIDNVFTIGRVWEGPLGELPFVGAQELVNRLAWEADIGEEPSLVDRVLALLTTDERAAWAVGTAELRHSVEHPHPLGIDRQDGGTCNACNAPFEEGDLAMVLTGDDSTAGAWCYACVAMVVEAIKCTRGAQ